MSVAKRCQSALRQPHSISTAALGVALITPETRTHISLYLMYHFYYFLFYYCRSFSIFCTFIFILLFYYFLISPKFRYRFIFYFIFSPSPVLETVPVTLKQLMGQPGKFLLVRRATSSFFSSLQPSVSGTSSRARCQASAIACVGFDMTILIR